jgi:hypothetical protein
MQSPQRLLAKPALGPKMKDSNRGASGQLQAPAQDGGSSNSHPPSTISAPCPIRFTRAICRDLGQVERREWWVANGLAGYAAGTIAGSLTRRYHGLLIAPVASPLGRRLILAKAKRHRSGGSCLDPKLSSRLLRSRVGLRGRGLDSEPSVDLAAALRRRLDRDRVTVATARASEGAFGATGAKKAEGPPRQRLEAAFEPGQEGEVDEQLHHPAQ